MDPAPSSQEDSQGTTTTPWTFDPARYDPPGTSISEVDRACFPANLDSKRDHDEADSPRKNRTEPESVSDAKHKHKHKRKRDQDEADFPRKDRTEPEPVPEPLLSFTASQLHTLLDMAYNIGRRQVLNDQQVELSQEMLTQAAVDRAYLASRRQEFLQINELQLALQRATRKSKRQKS